MMAKVALLLDRTPAMAVCTSDLTLRDLALDGRYRVLLVGELHNVIPLHPDMIEVQDDWIAFSAVRADGSFQVIDDEQQIPSPQRPALAGRPPVGINSPRSRTQRGPTAMAIGTDKLAI
jgi:hypothetical protein